MFTISSVQGFILVRSKMMCEETTMRHNCFKYIEIVFNLIYIAQNNLMYM